MTQAVVPSGVNLAAYADETALSADEIALWLHTSARAVRRLPLTPLAIACRPRRYLAGDVKRAILPSKTERVTVLRRRIG